MSTRESIAEDAKAYAHEWRESMRQCRTCRTYGGHHSGCPDAYDEPEIVDEQDDTEEEE